MVCVRCGRENVIEIDQGLWCSWCNDWAGPIKKKDTSINDAGTPKAAMPKRSWYYGTVFAKFFEPNIKELKRKRDFEGLFKALNHHHDNVRLKTISALDDLRADSSIDLLVAVLDDPAPLCRLNAALTLLSLDQSAGKKYLVRILGDYDQPPRLRAAVAIVLAHLGNYDGKDYLTAVPSDLEEEAMMMLRELGHPVGYLKFLNALSSKDRSLQQMCARTIELSLRLPDIRDAHKEQFEQALAEYRRR